MSPRRAAACGFALLWLPAAALAHSPSPAMGSFWGGVLHPFTAPAQLLVMLALGLLIGKQVLGSDEGTARSWQAFSAALVLGLLLVGFNVERELTPPLLVLALVNSLGVMMALHPPPAAGIGLAALCGIAVGLDSNPDPLIGTDRLVFMAGCWLGAFLCTGSAMILAEKARKPWQQIGLRIAGSWIAAATVLVLALALKQS